MYSFIDLYTTHLISISFFIFNDMFQADNIVYFSKCINSFISLIFVFGFLEVPWIIIIHLLCNIIPFHFLLCCVFCLNFYVTQFTSRLKSRSIAQGSRLVPHSASTDLAIFINASLSINKICLSLSCR